MLKKLTICAVVFAGLLLSPALQASNEIKTFDITGVSSPTDYVIILNSTGQVWNGSSFVTLTSSSWSSYAVSVSLVSGTTNLLGNFPTGITTPGDYTITTYQQSGGSPAATDQIIDGSYQLYWGGSSPISEAVAANNVASLPSASANATAVWGAGTRTLTGNVTIAGYASNEDPATLVLGATASNWNTSGTIGNKINSSGSASDPWATSLPGSYTSGQAGYILGNNLNAAITSRLASGNVTVGNYASGQDPATLVLGATASSWNTSGTIGNKINSGGASGDPWSTLLPGSYTSGEAGYILGNLPSASGILSTFENATVDGSITLQTLWIDQLADLTGKIVALNAGLNPSYKVLKQDGSTTAFTNTLHFSTTPTSNPTGRN